VKDAHSRIIWGINWSHDDALFAVAKTHQTANIYFVTEAVFLARILAFSSFHAWGLQPCFHQKKQIV
jgi:hypothetical protein